MVGYLASYTGTPPADGSNIQGNAATNGVLSGLNDYLAQVQAARPHGPVTVAAQSTSNTAPTLTGTVTLAWREERAAAPGPTPRPRAP